MQRLCYILIFITGCKEAYNPHLKNTSTNYLVVEGNIVAGNDSTVIHLTRTTTVSDSNIIHPESNATVAVESDGGDTYQLQNTGNGFYEAAPLNISLTKNYRVHIFTADGTEYASDFVPVKQTPSIDSTSWKLNTATGITIYANTHDATGSSQYYRWDYTETWEHRVRYESDLIFEDGFLRYRTPDEHVYRCWTINPATSILIASTTGLSSDIVFEKPLVQIPYGSEEISSVYSILVKQYALSKEAFQFWQNLKKNTEEIGSIFDAQPSTEFGNIHCLSNSKEIAVGYVSACSIAQQRIYIHNTDLSSWPYSLPQCETDTLQPTANISSILTGGAILPVYYLNLDLLVTGAECADCRIHGGSTIKPPYMP